jgi:hypothetical protein
MWEIRRYSNGGVAVLHRARQLHGGAAGYLSRNGRVNKRGRVLVIITPTK